MGHYLSEMGGTPSTARCGKHDLEYVPGLSCKKCDEERKKKIQKIKLEIPKILRASPTPLNPIVFFEKMEESGFAINPVRYALAELLFEGVVILTNDRYLQVV